MTENTKDESDFNITKSSFSKQIFLSGILPDIFLNIVIFIYIFYISGLIKYGFMQKNFSSFLILSFTVIFFCQFIVRAFTNHLITKKVSEKLYNFYKGETTEDERTDIVKELSHISVKISFAGIITFIIAFIFEYFIFKSFFTINKTVLIFIITSALQCLFMTALYSLNYSAELCSKKAALVSSKGLNEKRILKEKFFGSSLPFKLMIIFTASFFLSNLSHTVCYISAKSNSLLSESLIFRTLFIICVNTIICIAISYTSINKISKSFYTINILLKKFTDSTLKENVNLPLTFTNELSFNFFLINKIISFVSDIAKESMQYTDILESEILNLLQTSEKSKNLSLEHSGYITSLLSLINKENENLNKINKKITSLIINSNESKKSVNQGINIIQENILKMTEISDSNIESIKEIETLNKTIDKIWKNINKISDLSEKTKVIAFNTEIEASNSEKNEEKFHIVADEIRRLTSSVSDYVNEIKERILIMQHSCDDLIITSEAESQKIKDGKEIFTDLIDEKLSNIKMTSDIVDEASKDIQIQAEKEKEILTESLLLLKEIAEGFTKLSDFSQELYTTSFLISNSSALLTSLNKKEEKDVS